MILSIPRNILMLLGLVIMCGVFPLDISFIDASSTISNEDLNFVSSIVYFPPPLKQISEGTEPSNVTCTEEKELVLKQSNGLPACVNPSSIEKLISRGWAIHILPDYANQNNNSDIFAVGEFLTQSETVAYFDDTTGYLARPVISGNYPGVVMIHEW